MGNVRTFFFRNAATALSLSLAFSGNVGRGEDQNELPGFATSSEAVKQVFDVGSLRPLQRSSFESLRKYFSAKQQSNVDEFLRALDDLIAAKDRLATQTGIKEKWWWPANIGVEVHLITKNDPLTDRSTKPDEVRICAPKLIDAKLEITVKEVYKELATDGSDLGGAKESVVKLVPENRRWVIDEVAFETRQYGNTAVATLTQLLADETKQVRAAWRKITDEEPK